jgi:hypothetical protein
VKRGPVKVDALQPQPMRRRDKSARRYLRPRRRRVAERFHHDALGQVAAPDAHERPDHAPDLVLEEAVPLESQAHEGTPNAAHERQVYVLEFLHDGGAYGSHRGAARFTTGREHFEVVLADEALRAGPHFDEIEALDAPGHVVAGIVPERQVVGLGFLAHRRRRVERRGALSCRQHAHVFW